MERFEHQIDGVIDRIFEVKNTKSGDNILEFWLKTSERISQTIRLQLKNKSIDSFTGNKKGDQLRITFSISGRPTIGKLGDERCYNNNNVISIQKLN